MIGALVRLLLYVPCWLWKRIIGLDSNQECVNLYKTLWINLRAFPLRTALVMPIIVKNNVRIYSSGRILIQGTPKRGMLLLGGVTMFNSNYTRIDNKGTIILGNGSVIIEQGVLIHNLGLIEFKGSSFISSNTRLLIREKLTIGNQVRIGFDSFIMDSNDHFLVDVNNKTIHSATEPIIIGDWNWLGYRTYVKKGTITPDYFITAAPCAVLTKDYSSLNKGTIVGGIPARVIKESDNVMIFNYSNESKVRQFFKEHPQIKTVSTEFFDDDINRFCEYIF